MEHIKDVLDKWITETLVQRNKEVENAIRRIMQHRFGVLDTEGIKEFTSTHKCACCFDSDRNFIGISVNNRWLYTPNGQTIGKEGKRWKIEDVNYDKERIQRVHLPRQADARGAEELLQRA